MRGSLEYSSGGGPGYFVPCRWKDEDNPPIWHQCTDYPDDVLVRWQRIKDDYYAMLDEMRVYTDKEVQHGETDHLI